MRIMNIYLALVSLIKIAFYRSETVRMTVYTAAAFGRFLWSIISMAVNTFNPVFEMFLFMLTASE